jgi:hypothetical protein
VFCGKTFLHFAQKTLNKRKRRQRRGKDIENLVGKDSGFCPQTTLNDADGLNGPFFVKNRA